MKIYFLEEKFCLAVAANIIITVDYSKTLDLFSSELWFYRGSGGVDIVLIGGWRPRLFVLFSINLCVQGRTSNNNILEVKFLSIT